MKSNVRLVRGRLCRPRLGANAGLHGVPLIEARMIPTLSNEVSSLRLIDKLSRGMTCSYCCRLAILSNVT
jgi:hypothetical protein